MEKNFKIILYILISFILTFIFLAILPFFINLNKFKPQIQQAISKTLNAELNFESIDLTILSGLGFKLNNVTVTNTDEKFKNIKLFDVKEVQFHAELLPLLSGKVIARIEIEEPNLKLVKDKESNNISSLFKTDETKLIDEKNETIEKSDTTQDKKTDTQNKKADFSHYAKRIAIESFKISDAKIAYLDKDSKEKPKEVSHLNLNVSNLQLGRDMDIDFSTKIDVKEKDYSVSGPILINVTANTDFDASHWSKIVFQSTVNLDNLVIKYKNLFDKSDSIPFHFSFKGDAKPNFVQLSQFKLKLQNLGLDGNFTLKDFQKLSTEATFHLFSKDVSALAKILPEYKELISKGTFDTTMDLHGPLSNLNLISSTTKAKANLYQSDFDLLLQENSLDPLKGSVTLDSEKLNLGEIIKPFQSLQTEKQASPTLAYENLKFSNIHFIATIDKQLLNVSKLKMDLFDGTLNSMFMADLNVKPISYRGAMDLKNIQLEKLIEILDATKDKSPLVGVTDLKFTFNGKGNNQADASKYLNAQGTYFFHSGTLNNKNILSIASQELEKLKDKIKIPGIETGIEKLGSYDLGKNTKSDLKNANGNFTVKDGRILIDSLVKSDQGNMQINASVGLDKSLAGTAIYTSDKNTSDSLLNTDKNFAYIFNKEGQLELHLILGGDVVNPSVRIDEKNLISNVGHNSIKLLRSNPNVKKAEDSAKDFLKKKGIDLNKFGF